ncbi:hypothetical protein O3P69_010368 [Scylla paramamosain]|uniref:Uncharacterized protein n=1 Tax=Scylla paramamosain TaxID=85552 RepID=A0AAW0TTD6_SCYPA
MQHYPSCSIGAVPCWAWVRRRAGSGRAAAPPPRQILAGQCQAQYGFTDALVTFPKHIFATIPEVVA